jgi:hypothetical protein
MHKTMVGLALAASALSSAAGAQDVKRLGDHLSALNHVSCYPFGLDEIGRGDSAAGIEIWKKCFAPDYRFSVFLGFGQPTECPGDKCELTGATSIEKRAALARGIYEKAGYVRTSHHLANQTVSFTGADNVHVKSYLGAWHMKGDGSIVTGVGTWDVDLARNGEGWLISNEKLVIVGAGALQSLRR